MNTTLLPQRREMLSAFMARDTHYDGVFFTGVRTTGIFCMPSCPARKPNEKNIEFFASARDALSAGFRPCRRCRPLELPGDVPQWLCGLLAEVDAEPRRRWTDADLRTIGLQPDRVRRWFKANHGITFHAFARARRLGLAHSAINTGTTVTSAAMEHGYDSLSGFNTAFKELLGNSPKSTVATAAVMIKRIMTPLGPLVAAANDNAVVLLEFADRRMLERQMRRVQRHFSCRVVPGTNRVLDHLAEELAAYFNRQTRRFDTPIATPGTDFQCAVWERLRAIPYGDTMSYRELATELGRPSSVRAVARANGDNRIAILVPCHRVIGSNGKLTGYGGGLWRKQRLLEVEAGAVDL